MITCNSQVTNMEDQQMSFSGGCLCGAVRYRGETKIAGGHCHCNDCRKSSGSGHCSHMVVPEDGFSLTGEVKFFAYSDFSNYDENNVLFSLRDDISRIERRLK